MKIDMIIAKKGDILFSIFESARSSLSTAQKFAMSPAVPKRHLMRSPGMVGLLILNFSLLPASTITAMKKATRFLKSAFCIVGRSPESFKNKVISEKPSAARII